MNVNLTTTPADILSTSACELHISFGLSRKKHSILLKRRDRAARQRNKAQVNYDDAVERAKVLAQQFNVATRTAVDETDWSAAADALEHVNQSFTDRVAAWETLKLAKDTVEAYDMELARRGNSEPEPLPAVADPEAPSVARASKKRKRRDDEPPHLTVSADAPPKRHRQGSGSVTRPILSSWPLQAEISTSNSMPQSVTVSTNSDTPRPYFSFLKLWYDVYHRDSDLRPARSTTAHPPEDSDLVSSLEDVVAVDAPCALTSMDHNTTHDEQADVPTINQADASPHEFDPDVVGEEAMVDDAVESTELYRTTEDAQEHTAYAMDLEHPIELQAQLAGCAQVITEGEKQPSPPTDTDPMPSVPSPLPPAATPLESCVARASTSPRPGQPPITPPDNVSPTSQLHRAGSSVPHSPVAQPLQCRAASSAEPDMPQAPAPFIPLPGILVPLEPAEPAGEDLQRAPLVPVPGLLCSLDDTRSDNEMHGYKHDEDMFAEERQHVTEESQLDANTVTLETHAARFGPRVATPDLSLLVFSQAHRPVTADSRVNLLESDDRVGPGALPRESSGIPLFLSSQSVRPKEEPVEVLLPPAPQPLARLDDVAVYSTRNLNPTAKHTQPFAREVPSSTRTGPRLMQATLDRSKLVPQPKHLAQTKKSAHDATNCNSCRRGSKCLLAFFT